MPEILCGSICAGRQRHEVRFQVVAAPALEFREEVVPIDRPVNGDLLLRFAIDEGATNLAANAPLVAGSYVDTLTIVLEPQQ